MNIKFFKIIQFKVVALSCEREVVDTFLPLRIGRLRDIIIDKFEHPMKRRSALDSLRRIDEDLDLFIKSNLKKLSSDTIVDEFIKSLISVLGEKGGVENHKFLRDFVYYDKALIIYRIHAVFSLGLNPSLDDVEILIRLVENPRQNLRMRVEALYTLGKIYLKFKETRKVDEIYLLAHKLYETRDRDFIPHVLRIWGIPS